ncbi:MAG: FAD-dependent oxidoreductase [Gammaproteobacteria bacterium]|nr:FAD-dependent oxidoreductase [Gammaproteobacteria bacterium]
MTTSPGRALIIGGSMAGLFAAIALKKHGWEIAIYERASDELAGRGAGIATHDELYAALRNAGVNLRDEMGVRSRGRLLLAPDGGLIGTLDAPQIMTSWGLMYRFLRAQLPDDTYRNGANLVNVTQTADGVTAHFQDGSITHGDWLIGADGTRSSVRQIIAPEVRVNYCGYFAWRGLIDEALVPSAALEEVAYRMALCLAPGGHWLGYLVAGPNDTLTPGQRWYNWGWYRTADDDRLRDHLTDSSGQYYEHGIPHNRMRADLIQAMRREAEAQLAPQCQAIIAATAHPFIQGIIDLGCDRLRYGRVCLVGDAAITARPHIGLGVSKAAEDAYGLAEALSASTQDRALAQWESERLAYGHAALAFSRDLGSYIGPAPNTEAHKAKAAYHQRPEILLEATAPNEPRRWLNLKR